MREKICGVYKISSKVHSDRIYVGSTVEYTERVRKHLSKLKNQTHNNPKLQAHYNKYGEADFVFELIEQFPFTTLEYLLEREQYYLDTLSPYLNVCMVAGSSLGVKKSEETRRKIGEKSRGHKMPPHVKELLVSINKGSHHTEESKKKISESHKGKKKPYMTERNRGNTYGRANKGKKKSVPSPFKGKKRDKPSPLKGRKTGIVPATAFKKGNVTWNTGMKLPYNPHPKQSESMRAYWARRKGEENIKKDGQKKERI